MAKAGLEPDSNTTRPIYLHLTSNETLLIEAWEVLKNLHKDGHVVPVAAVNVVLEATIKLGYLEKAVGLYKELHRICEGGPNTETFNVLLQGTSRIAQGAVSNKGAAMFLASEMRALGIKADWLTYDRFILVCLQEEDFEDAFRYLEEMKTVGADKEEKGRKGWWMRKGTASLLIRRCVNTGDPRAWNLLAEVEDRGFDDGRLREWVETNWKGSEFLERSQEKETIEQLVKPLKWAVV